MSLSWQTFTGMNGLTDSVILHYVFGYHGDEPNIIESGQRNISLVGIFPIEMDPKKTQLGICVHAISLMLSCHTYVPNNLDPLALSRYSLNPPMLNVSPVVEKIV